MVNFNKISKIGIGTYRMSIESAEHHASLRYAIENGINLIDTAHNYQLGNSEKLIGAVLGEIDRSSVFLVTKGGYIQGQDIQKVSSFMGKKILKINSNFYYSIDKEILKFQLFNSLKRLNTDYLDCFLIHNPEHYFDIDNELQPYFYEHLEEAFTYLESLVSEGVIRSYGISSNTWHSPDNEKCVDIRKVLGSHNKWKNFRFVQFPYNFVEKKADEETIGRQSLIEFCKGEKIITLSNRPLNTVYQNNVIRIADYSDEVMKINDARESELFHELLTKVESRLLLIQGAASPVSVSPISFFTERRKAFANPEALNVALQTHLIPYLGTLGLNDQHTRSTVLELKYHWELYSKKLITERANNLKQRLLELDVIDSNDTRDLSAIACDYYLSKGIDHVLVGLRKKKYIERLLEVPSGFNG
jgi:aryl-alcohol dehydrogenase-like predicted oxidoreductase